MGIKTESLACFLLLCRGLNNVMEDLMARKRHKEEDILRILREIEINLNSGADVASACRHAGISDKTYYVWRKKLNGECHWFE